MTILKLSSVTLTLKSLLEKNIVKIAGVISDMFEVVAQAPDKVVDNGKPALSVYLYHAREDAHYKNADQPGGTVANTALALNLYYVVTAHRTVDDAPDPLEEQTYLGYALKTFHDYPIITSTTKVDDVPVMDEADILDGDNTLQIIYRPLSPEEILNFWNGDDARLIRFSAFYEVRVVLLDRDEPTHIPGYVLTVGNYVLPTGVMSIVASESVVRFTPPGGETLALIASPARVALSLAAPPGETPSNQLTLRGTRFGGGQLVLRSPLFETTNNQIVVDPALNTPDWSIAVTPSRYVARVRGAIERPLPLTPQPILPGIYGASIQVTTQYQLPGGLTKTLVTRTNEIAIAVTPSIDVAFEVLVDGDGAATITLEDEFDLHATELEGEITVLVNSQVYPFALGPMTPGHAQLGAGNTILIKALFTSGNPGIYPVRVIIRGAETQPYWIVVP